MKIYEFTITLEGKGDCPRSAWQDAFECFSTDPRCPDDDQIEVVAECCDECGAAEGGPMKEHGELPDLLCSMCYSDKEKELEKTEG